MYLDYNATTPLHPEAARAMRPFLEESFGNPSSIHAAGRAARAAVDDARQTMAALLGAQPKEIVFTSGGTESDNLALFGAARTFRKRGRHVVSCTTEHHAVLHSLRRLEEDGAEVTVLPVDGRGRLDLERLKAAIRPDTVLVSLMSANNETGVRHPVAEIGRICREKWVAFHCDAVQSFGKEPVDVEAWNVDLLSLSAHKFYGPKGVGLLHVRTGLRLEPLILGGAHENERRAGTENVAGIAGMAAAARAAAATAETENRRLFDLTERLWSGLREAIPGVRRNGDPIHRLGNTLNASFEGCDGEALLAAMDLEDLAVSSGSACMVGSVLPSHVLQAMGLEERLIRATVRFSFGSGSSEKDVPEIVRRTKGVVERLRASRPGKVGT